MINQILINYFKSENLWLDKQSENSDELFLLDSNKNSDFFIFYSHLNTGTGVDVKDIELLGLIWHLINTNYYQNSKYRRTALNMPENFIFLDSFEGEGGYIYNSLSGEVIDYDTASPNPDKINRRWVEFSAFLAYLFLEQDIY